MDSILEAQNVCEQVANSGVFSGKQLYIGNYIS